MAQFQGVDSSVIPNIGSPMYGCLYEQNTVTDGAVSTTITVSAADTWYGWVSATAGVLQGITADVADGTADHLTVPAGGAGDYYVAFSMSGRGETAAQEMVGGVHVNGSVSVITGDHLHSANDLGTISGVGVLALSDSDEISLRIMNSTGTGNYFVRFATLSIYRIAV